MTSGTTKEIRAVWGNSGNDIFAVGRDGTILHYDGNVGGNWTTMTSGTTQSLAGIWGSSGSDVFAVGSFGRIIHYDGNVGGNWTTMTSGTAEMYQGVWGSSGNDVFAVGWSGVIRHYNGTDWSSMSSPTMNDLNGVWGSARDDVFAVGKYGTILHYSGAPPGDDEVGFCELTGDTLKNKFYLRADDGTTTLIHNVEVEAQFTHRLQAHRGKCFIDFNTSEIIACRSTLSPLKSC